jgi:hypothetical protein
VSQHVILNPTPRHPLNPDYAFQRKRPITHLNAKANRGRPYFRDLTDVGHQIVMNWMDKSVDDADRLKNFYEQFQDGFFTYIDHEGGGRHYVGHFTSPVEPSPTSHGHWGIQQVTFDEVPNVPMLVYPHRWDKDAIWQLLINDYGDGPMAATSGTWTLTANALAKSNGQELDSPGTATADWAAYQYRGYGFQLWARTGPNMGIAQVTLDGAVLGDVDFYAPAASQASAIYTSLNVPLGIHVVQINPTNTKNASSSGTTIVWDALRVMR